MLKLNFAILSENHRERVTQILARLKKKKENHLGHLATFWFGTFTMFFSATGCVVHHETLK